VRADAGDHVADVRHALPVKIVLDPGKRLGVLLQNLVQGRQRRQSVGFDLLPDLGQQAAVLEDRHVGPKNLGLGRADLLLDLGDDALQLLAGQGHGPVEPFDLPGDVRRVVELDRLQGADRRLDAVSRADDHPRTDRDTLTHTPGP
jgi:hypothetical protein